MPTQGGEVNPLRPYHKPPTMGDGNAAPTAGLARHVFADIDYKDYIGESSMGQTMKELVDELMWKYASVLMAQPFEVAKTILQAKDQGDNAASAPPMKTHARWGQTSSSRGISAHDNQDSDSEGDEMSYFTSTAPETPTPSSRGRAARARHAASPTPSPQRRKQAVTPEHYLQLGRPDSVLEVIGQLWQKDGVWGVWKGSNATFLYTVLKSLLENWSRSFLSAILNVPDLGVKEDIDRLVDIASPYPWASLFVAGTAAVATGLLLSPLDLVRTRLIMTPGNSGQRRTLPSLRSLPSYLCPSSIAMPTILNSLIHPLLTLSTPLLLRTRFMIDSQVSPMTFSVTKFCASSAAILIKLPIETVLRRGQMAVLADQAYVGAFGAKGQSIETIVPVGRYHGIFGTLYHIASEEGTREVPPKQATAKRGRVGARALQPTHKKGQGLQGLWRGWKGNWWGLVGLWTASVVGNGGEGEF
ncbi:Mitochondrial carrier domain protein [Ophiocordyceps sinensis CO18]|uniref:Mitochondrial carrier domain protein n=1 Tax=Ophiocordyceps sinensis (strain Co18 / CGMCC 3.14243) TaxID=911162 RepID=T5AC22_OPHSC|nr:Mitochondrial carrier domain protein [Ophiocordyceps sinensis CO18]